MSVTLDYFLRHLHLQEVSRLGLLRKRLSSPTPPIFVLWTFVILDFQLYSRCLYNLLPSKTELFRSRFVSHSCNPASLAPVPRILQKQLSYGPKPC